MKLASSSCFIYTSDLVVACQEKENIFTFIKTAFITQEVDNTPFQCIQSLFRVRTYVQMSLLSYLSDV